MYSKAMASGDLRARALWVDLEYKNKPDIVGNPHDRNLYLAIKELQRQKCLAKISERTWKSLVIKQPIFELMRDLLRSDGVLEIVDSSAFTENPNGTIAFNQDRPDNRMVIDYKYWTGATVIFHLAGCFLFSLPCYSFF